MAFHHDPCASIIIIVLTTPSTEEEIATVHAASEEDVDKAVQAAHKAFHTSTTWKSPAERGLLMSKLADLIEEHKTTLAAIDAWDNGNSPPDPVTW